MSDLVERLYQMNACGLQGYHDPQICAVLREAQEEITRLVGQVERARKVIEPFAMLCRLDTKPEQSALDSVHPMVAVGRLRDALEYIDGLSHPSTVREPGQ